MKQSFKCLLFPWQLNEGLGITSLVFLKPHFGALSAVLAPFFCSVMLCLRLYVCDSHFCMPFVSGF